MTTNQLKVVLAHGSKKTAHVKNLKDADRRNKKKRETFKNGFKGKGGYDFRKDRILKSLENQTQIDRITGLQ